MCRVLVAHMIKTRILQHCKKIKHVSVLHLVLIRFFLFCTVADAAPLPMCIFTLVSSVQHLTSPFAVTLPYSGSVLVRCGLSSNNLFFASTMC